MDSKEVLETFGISKNFGILLFIQSIIVLIGCFLACQEAYNNFIVGDLSLIIVCIINILLFIFLIYYSFIGYRKDEKHFKIAVYLFMIYLLITIIVFIGTNTPNYNLTIPIIGNLIILILSAYFVYNLDKNSTKAKISIFLVVLVKFILWIIMTIGNGAPIESILLRIYFIIPCVSIALTYIARYDKESFKQLTK